MQASGSAREVRQKSGIIDLDRDLTIETCDVGGSRSAGRFRSGPGCGGRLGAGVWGGGQRSGKRVFGTMRRGGGTNWDVGECGVGV